VSIRDIQRTDIQAETSLHYINVSDHNNKQSNDDVTAKLDK